MKAKKRFFKPLAFFMVVCMLVSLGGVSGVVLAASNESEVEIIVADDVDSEKAQLIIDTINKSNEKIIGISPAGLACLFGHSTATTSVREISHKYYATSPRCVEKTYRITYCTRSDCNYNTGTLISDLRIYCCS